MLSTTAPFPFPGAAPSPRSSRGPLAHAPGGEVQRPAL